MSRLLEELGVEYDWVKARPRSKEAFEFSPFGKIPALKDGEFMMYESVAINTYVSGRRAARAYCSRAPQRGGCRPAPAVSFRPSQAEADVVRAHVLWLLSQLADKYRGRPGQPDLIPAAGTTLRGMYEQKVMCIASELDAQGLWIHRKHEALAGILAPACPVAVAHARSHVLKVRPLTRGRQCVRGC